MYSVDLFSTSKPKTTIKLSDALFLTEDSMRTLAQAVRVYLANKRQGTSSVKNKAAVSRTTKKVYKQKRTGGARHGSRKAPIFVGGGVAHGPKLNQNWILSLSKKQKHVALKTALTAQRESLTIIDFADTTGKTQQMKKLMDKINPDARRILMVLNAEERVPLRALRNLATVTPVDAQMVTALDIAQANHVLISKAALPVLEGRVAKTTKAA